MAGWRGGTVSLHDPGAGLEVREHTGPPAGWDALLEGDPGAGPSQRREVADAIAAVLPNHRATWLTVEQRGALIGGVAGCVRSVAAFETLHVMPYLLPGASVAVAGRHADVDHSIAMTLARWTRERRFVGGEWVCYRPGCPPDRESLERPSGETRTLVSSIIDLSDGPRPLQSRLDKEARRMHRVAHASGLQFGEHPEALEAVYALYLTQARGWPGHRRVPIELLRRLIAHEPGREPAARLFVARDARRLLCGIVTLDHVHESLAWWIGTHPAAREAAAPAGLLWWMVEWCAAHGRRRLNLGGSGGLPGIAAFKRSIGAQDLTYPVRWLRPERPSAGVRLLAALQARRRRGRHQGNAG